VYAHEYRYVCSQVVAPVRETCAQTIGVILKHTDAETVKRVTMVLLTLQAQEEWEVRHGGLMGLKYLMAVRQVQNDQITFFCKITEINVLHTLPLVDRHV